MGVIQQLGEYSGNPYSFKIAGDTPTVEEAGRISQILSQQELPYQQRYEAQYGGIRSVASAPEDTDRTAFGRGFAREPSQRQRGFGVAEQYLADTAIGRALGLDPEAGIERQRLAEEELARLEAEDPSIGFRDITGLDTAASFAGEQLGSEARDTAIQLGATATGAAIGSVVPVVGTAIGAGVGRGLGVGYTTVQALPQMFAEAIDKQKEAGGDINLTKALGATTANALSEFIVDYFIIGKFLPPGVDAGALKRAVVEGGKSAGVEGAQEVSQSVVNRAQAGLNLTSEDALMEYAEAFSAGSVVGGTLGGVGGVVSGRGESEGSKELNEDLKDTASETRDRLGYADEISKELTSEVERQNDEAIAFETPQVKQQAEGMGISEVTTDEEFESNTFDKAQYDRVMQQVKADMAREKSLSVTGIQQKVKKDLPGTKVSQVRDIMAEMESRGYLESDSQQGAVTDRKTGVRYRPAAQYQPTQNMVPQLKTPDVSYRRQIDIANEAVEKNKQIIAGLKLDLDSVREYGRDLQGKRTSENAIQYEMDRLNKRNAQYGELVNGAQQGLQRLGNLPYVPKVTPETGKAQSIEAKVAAAKARSVADQVKEKVQSNNPVFTPAINEKQSKVLESIRKRLDGYGLKDVKLNVEQQVKAPDGAEVEGVYNPFGRVIALSMGIYDPKLSETELFNRVGEVLDHETTHALKEMNVITPSEWSSLTNAAGKVKYAKTKDGQAQKRKYSYLDRAKRMYSQDTAEVQAEEAVAEMFRDYNSGRLKLAGKPKGLFNKIKNFFKSIVGGSVDNGFTDVQSIFDNINVGEIGGRDRGQAIAQETQPAVRSSRIAATEEEVRPLEEIRMPIDSTAPNDQIRAQIQRMTNQNRPIVKRMVKRIDERFGTKSGDNAKDLSKVTQKANRPSIKAKKPWHDVSHIRDSYRFKTVIPDFRDVPAIFDELLAEGIGLVKIDTNKLFQPGEWGWRIIAFDLRMPNGQLVEWYLPLKELEAEKKARGHLIFEEWRNKTQEEMNAKQVDFMKALDTSWTNYNDAFLTSIDRMGLSPQEAEASWRNAETSISEAALNSRRSSGMMVSSRDSLGTQVPSSDLNIGSEPSLNRTARSVPSSINARAAMLSTSDDYVTGVPVENQVKFSRLPRTSNVSGLQSFIRSNPDGFTIDPVTMEPVSSGFVVAPLKEAEIIVGETLPEEVLLGYIDDNKDIARATNKPVYLGGWFDEDSQQYFLDNTLIVPTAEEALYIAEAADQLAIFNLNNFEEIRTNEGIRQLQANGTYRGDTAVGYQRNLAEVGRRFAEARDNRNSRQKEQLTRGVEGYRQSRLSLPLTPEQRAASVLDYLDPNTGQPKFKSKPGSETLVSFANKLLELRGTRSYDLNSPDDREEVARIMAAEAEAALLSSSDALGWYDSTLKLAKQILFPVYPEVSPLRPDGTENALYDPASEHAFDFATAITSNGLSVIDNYLLASRQYDAWKNSTDGRFPLAASGKQGQSMMKAWEFWNHLTDFGYDSNQINELLMTQLPKGELAGLMTEVFGVERVKDLPFKIDGKELASETVGVAYVLGPKIGNGFYQNLRGNFSPLTMDRWWMRFVNRITGNPIVDYNDELVQANKDKLWSMISNPDSLSDTDKKLLVDTVESLEISTIEKSDIELIAPQVQKIWDKNFYNKAFNDKLESLSDQYDFVVTRTGTVTGKDAAKVKKLAQEARPASTDLSLAAKNLAAKLKPELQEDPRNATERASMRATAVRAREILRNSNQLALDITNADFQALMWYAEKRIFEAGGVRKGRGDDNDYADGAIAILENKGVSDDKIKATLPSSERGRLSSVKSQLKRDAEIGREIDQIQRGPIEGNFFAPRELTILDSSMAAQEQLTQQELAETNADMSGLEVDPELPPQRFSRMITADALVPVRAPVNLKDGSSNPVYGYFMDRGRLRPIVLPKGSHRTYESGVEVGQGLFHIQQRNHDKELVENSKYKRVENAIYDMLRRWQDQGYDDGPAVISYPSQNGIVLEWRNNIAFSAPPMRLVLESGRDLPNAPAKDVFYIKTFFPILEKKARKTSPVVRQSIMYSTLSENVREKQYNLNYAKAADFLGKGLGFVLPKDKAQDAADAVIRKFQDDMLPVGRMIQELKKDGANITDAFDAYLQEELYHGRVGAEVDTRQKTIYKDAVDAVKVLNVPASKVNELKTLSSFFSKVLESYPSKKLAIADAVLYATHAKERNAYIRKGDPKNNSGSGMTDGEADAILAWVATLDAPSISALQGIQSSVRAILKDTNNSRADYGLTPEELREDKNFNSYVPLQGKDDPTDGDVGSGARLGAKGFGVRGREDRRALGRFDYARDILATVFNQNQNTVVRGERNRVGQAFIKLLQAEPEKTRGFGRILDRLPTMRTKDEYGNVVRVRDPFAAQDDNIFFAKVDGKDVYVELNDARIARALKGSDGTGSSSLAAITRALGKMNRYLSSINTSYNPEFLITNIIRDIQTAGVNVQQFDAKGMVKSMAKDYTKAFAGIKRAIRDGDKNSEWAKIYEDFVRDGGQNSANPMNSVADQIANIENVLGDIAEDGARGKFNKMKNSFAGEKVGSLFRFLEDYNTVAENAIRVAVYKGLKDKGFTNERAAQAARNVTVNFGKGGENKTAMNSFYLFYNASIQGSFALFNGLLRSPKVRKVWGGLIAFGLMQDFINSLISEEDEDEVLVYDKIPDYILEHNLVLATGGLTDRGYIAIPMPYGLNSAVNAGRSLGRTLRGEYSASEGATSAIMTLVDSLNPLGGTENMLNFASPTVADPFIEIMRNENFAGIPIYKEQYPGDQSPDSQRYFNSVSPSSKWIAENVNSLTGGTNQMSGFLDWNPEIMDYWFDYLTGGIGRFVQRSAVDVPISVYNDGLTEDLVSEIPFIRKIIGSVSEREDIGIFVEKRDRVLRVGQEVKAAQEAGDRDRFMRAREKYSDEIALLPRVKAINNAIRKVSKQQNIVRDNVNIPDSQKKLILERLDEQKQMLYARGNMMMKDYR